MATYVNNLRLKEISTGDESGTWGTSTNTNLELIGQALGYGTEAITTNANTHATTIADGSADEGRALMLKYTGTLDSTCTITIGPNTIKKVWVIENATGGAQSIIVKQGSGDNVTIANGRTAVVYSDGAGAGADMIDALTDLTITDSLTVGGTTLTIGDAAAEDTKLVFDGNAKDFYVGLDDSADKLVIGEGSTVGTNSILTITDDTVTLGDGAAVDTAIVYDGNAKDFYIGLDDSADKLVIGEGSTVGTNNILTITDDTVTVGDGAAADTAIVYDGNAKDFYIGLDDSADTLVIGDGSTVGTNSILTLTDDSVTVGDGAAVDTKIVYDGNAKDFYIGLDDSADTLVIGDGSTVGTNSILTLTDDSVTIGDGAAVDTKVVFDGNAQDFYIGLDDSADDLVIGLGSAVGTTPAIAINESQQVTFAQNATFSGTLTSGGAAVKVAGLETIYVPAAAMYPNTTNGCAALAQVELTNGPELKCLDFADGADDFAQFTVIFPKSWNEGTVTFQAFWTVTGTNTGTVAWGLSGGSMSDDASINTAFGTNVVATAKAFSGTSNDMTVSATSGAVTIANAAVDTMTYFQIMRDISADTQTGAARLLGIKLFFTTDAANDA